MQDELVEVIGEQLSRMKDDAKQLKKLTTRIGILVAENEAKSAALVKQTREHLEAECVIIESKDDKFEALQEESFAKDEKIAELEHIMVIDIAAKDVIITRLNGESVAKDAIISRLERESVARDSIITEFTAASMIRRLGSGPTIAELEASSAIKDASIAQLQKKYDIDMAASTTARNAVIVQRDDMIVMSRKAEIDRLAAVESKTSTIAKLQQAEKVHEKETSASAKQISDQQSQLGAYEAEFRKQVEEIKQLTEAAIHPVMRDQSEEIVRLKKDVQEYKNCAKSNHDSAKDFEAENKSLKDGGYVQQSSGGSFFNRIVSIMNAAASVMDWRIEWDRAGCEKLVVGLVEPMVSASTPNRVKAVRTMVVQLMNPVQRLVEELIEQRRMRLANGKLADDLAAGGCHVGKKAKRSVD